MINNDSQPITVTMSGRVITIQGVAVIFKNFSGVKTRFNAEGNRNFNIVFDKATADFLTDLNLNVKVIPKRDEDQEDTYRLKVSINFGSPFPPDIHLIKGLRRITLGEETIAMLDVTRILKCDLSFNLSKWTREQDGSTGNSAYLRAMYVTAEDDILFNKYNPE